MAETMADYPPRETPASHPPAVSGIETVYIEEENRPIMVGERTNVSGSRKFKRLIAEGKYRRSVGDRPRPSKGRRPSHRHLPAGSRTATKLTTWNSFLPHVVKKVKVPLMIDSTYERCHRAGA